MNQDDLLKAFGFDETPKKVKYKKELEKPPEEDTPIGDIQYSDSCLEVDKWDLARGEDILSLHARTLNGLTVEAVADFNAICFLIAPQPSQSKPRDTRRMEFVTRIMESPETQELRVSTILNRTASELAAVEFGEQFLKLLEEDAKVPKGKKEELKKEKNIVKRVYMALEKANKEVEEMDDLCHTLGCGEGIDGQKLDPKTIGNLFQRVRNDERLRHIFESAGRFRLFTQSQQRKKVLHGYDDMVGVELSGDVGRLLPLELAYLSTEEFELDAMRRLVEGQSFSRKFEGVENVGKGPVVFVVDESGSMDGPPVELAKAFALSLAWIANHQKRWCCLIGFSGTEKGNVLVLKPGKWNQAELLDWLVHFYGRGTELDVPLHELPFEIWPKIQAPKGKTDLIIMTDAIVRAPDKMVKAFNEWRKKEQCKVISLILNNPPGDLAKVSDEWHHISSVSVEESGIASALSI